MGKRALVCGISGQDGTYLAKLLLERGYKVKGSSRDAELTAFNNLRRLSIFDSVQLVSLNLRDTGSAIGLLQRIRPDEIFSLAGQSSVGLSFEQPVETIESIALGTLTLLEAVRISNPDIRLYNAGSSECFGDTGKFTLRTKIHNFIRGVHMPWLRHLRTGLLRITEKHMVCMPVLGSCQTTIRRCDQSASLLAKLSMRWLL